jgi:hypothetical protein
MKYQTCGEPDYYANIQFPRLETQAVHQKILKIIMAEAQAEAENRDLNTLNKEGAGQSTKMVPKDVSKMKFFGTWRPKALDSKPFFCSKENSENRSATIALYPDDQTCAQKKNWCYEMGSEAACFSPQRKVFGRT